MTWLRPSSLAVSCRRLVALAGFGAAGLLLSAGAAHADDAGESSLLGEVSQTVETVTVDTVLEETTAAVAPVVEETTQQVTTVTEPATEPVEVVVESVVEPVVEPVETVVKPVAQVVEPVAEVAEPVTKVVTPVVETIERATEAVAPVTETVAPDPDPEPVADVIEPDVLGTDEATVEQQPVSASGQQVDVALLAALESVEVLMTSATSPVDSHAPAPSPETLDIQEPVPTRLPGDTSRAGLQERVESSSSHPPADPAPSQTGTCSTAGGGASARAGHDGWTDDPSWSSDARKGAAPHHADSTGPRDPFRDIPTSPA